MHDDKFLHIEFLSAVVSKDAASTIREFLDKMEFGDTSFIVSTSIGLVEKLPSLVEGGKRVEIKMQFQLLMGYLLSVRNKGASAIANSASLKRALIRKYKIEVNSNNV
jgi:hypothetical protein